MHGEQILSYIEKKVQQGASAFESSSMRSTLEEYCNLGQ
jgi:hypothetical protein